MNSASPRVRLAPWFLVPLLLGLAGCAKVYTAKVSAIQDPKVLGGHAYEIVSKQPGMAESDPHYQQATILVRNALAGRGMYPAPEGVEPEVVVELDYEVGSRRIKVTADRTEDMVADPMRRLGIPPTGTRPFPTARTDDGRVIHHVEEREQTLTATPQFDKRLSISARKVEPGEGDGEKRGAEMWRVEVTITDVDDDLARTLPVLAGAAVDYIGKDTGVTQQIRIAEDAEQVAFVKGTRRAASEK